MPCHKPAVKVVLTNIPEDGGQELHVFGLGEVEERPGTQNECSNTLKGRERFVG